MASVVGNRIARGTLTSIMAIAVLCSAAAGKTIYVDASATGSNTGASWEQAINSLQDALLLAYFSSEPVEIRVARGVYRPDRGLGIMPGDRTASFELMSGVTIKGGYLGARRPDVEARRVGILQTVLSGDIGVPDQPDDNSYHVVTGADADATAVLDGCIITGGNGETGGGMYNDAGGPTVINCTFRDNHAVDGGGLANVNNSRPVLNNCTFTQNSAGNRGGGVYNDGSSPILTNCVFGENSAGEGGAMFNNAQSASALTSCTFNSNSARGVGGGMCNHESNPMLAGCAFGENSTVESGGGMINIGADPILLRCVFRGNSAGKNGGAVSNREASLPTLINCLLAGNSANVAAGMENADGSSATLTNCTFAENSAAEGGGALSNVLDAQATLTSCILWGDTPGEIGGGGVMVNYCNVQGGHSGMDNLNADPMFADADGDYHLKSQAGRWDPETGRWVVDAVSSPCIDAGNPVTAADLAPAYTEMMGPTSVVGDSSGAGFEPFPNGGRINMGAYGGTLVASLSPAQLVLLAAKASGPSPANGAVGVSRSIDLTWAPGRDAVSHDVYLGVESERVVQASRNNPDGVLVSMGQTTTIYNPPGSFYSGQTYYWRVDEISSQGSITVGDVWTFTTTAVVKGRSCFTAETPVWADGVLVPISQVRPAQGVGDVAGVACVCGSVSCLGTVERLQEHVGTFTCYDVVFETGNSISVASCHFFLTDSGQWIALQNLQTGTRLQTAKGSVTIAAVYQRVRPYVGKVYNLKIKGSDRYLVGKDAVIARDY